MDTIWENLATHHLSYLMMKGLIKSVTVHIQIITQCQLHVQYLHINLIILFNVVVQILFNSPFTPKSAN